MATAPRQGLNVSRELGSGPFNGSQSAYTLASGYGTALAVGDLVKLSGTGSNIQVGANSTYNLGVVQGFKYVDPSTGYERIIDYWPASQTSTGTVETYVVDDPDITYNVICNNPIGDMAIGLFYPLTLSAPNSLTRRSTMQLNNVVTETGSLAVTGTNNAGLTGLQNGSAFNISTSVNTTPVTITVITNQTPAQLLALLNAVPGITASLNGSNFLVVSTTDGGSLILADGTHTPLASSSLLTTAGTYTASVAKSASAVKVVKIIDTVNNVVEVVLTNHELLNNR
jgi:hypothetical protein